MMDADNQINQPFCFMESGTVSGRRGRKLQEKEDHNGGGDLVVRMGGGGL